MTDILWRKLQQDGKHVDVKILSQRTVYSCIHMIIEDQDGETWHVQEQPGSLLGKHPDYPKFKVIKADLARGPKVELLAKKDEVKLSYCGTSEVVCKAGKVYRGEDLGERWLVFTEASTIYFCNKLETNLFEKI